MKRTLYILAFLSGVSLFPVCAQAQHQQDTQVSPSEWDSLFEYLEVLEEAWKVEAQVWEAFIEAWEVGAESWEAQAEAWELIRKYGGTSKAYAQDVETAALKTAELYSVRADVARKKVQLNLQQADEIREFIDGMRTLKGL